MQRFLNQHILLKESRFLKSVGKDRGAPHMAPVHRAGDGGVVFSIAPAPPYQQGHPSCTRLVALASGTSRKGSMSQLRLS